MNCRLAQTKISSYVDGEMSGFEMMEMRAHLAECRQCEDEVEGYRRVKLLLSALPEQEPPSDFEERLASRVFSEGATSVPRRRASLAWVCGFAFAASCLSGLLWLQAEHRAKESLQTLRPTASHEMERDQNWYAASDPLSPQVVLASGH